MSRHSESKSRPPVQKKPRKATPRAASPKKAVPVAKRIRQPRSTAARPKDRQPPVQPVESVSRALEETLPVTELVVERTPIVASPMRQTTQRPPEADPSLQKLIIFGWIVALLYFPSGLLHHFLGSLVYFRDILLGAHLTCSIFWLVRRNQFKWVAVHSWVILIIPVMLLPAVVDPNYRMEALRTCKWSISWIDWIILGHFLRLNKVWGQWGKTLIIITLAELVLELCAGFIEWRTGDFLFKTNWGERTAFGVLSGNDQYLENQMRIRGLQRDVFSFANLMAMSSVAGAVLLTISRDTRSRWGWGIWTVAFGGMVFVSGGRSALFGVAAAGFYAICCMLIPAFSRIMGRSYVALWVVIASALSLYGVGSFTDFVGENLLHGVHVGDATSAYMRDNFWDKMLADFRTSPIILLLGGPFASLIDHRVDVMFHWADNQFLWNLYHTGIAGFLGIMLFFYKVLLPEPTEKDWMIRRALIFFLVFVLGEGIARESLTFMGCLPLFVLCGHYNASQYRLQLFEPVDLRGQQRAILNRWRTRR